MVFGGQIVFVRAEKKSIFERISRKVELIRMNAVGHSAIEDSHLSILK